MIIKNHVLMVMFQQHHFPAKPLGGYGDGGAIFTNDSKKADIYRSIRVHGQGIGKYDNIRVGLNNN